MTRISVFGIVLQEIILRRIIPLLVIGDLLLKNNPPGLVWWFTVWWCCVLAGCEGLGWVECVHRGEGVAGQDVARLVNIFQPTPSDTIIKLIHSLLTPASLYTLFSADTTLLILSVSLTSIKLRVRAVITTISGTIYCFIVCTYLTPEIIFLSLLQCQC